MENRPYPFVQESTGSFPPDYARFYQLNELTHRLYRLPDEVPFGQAYETAWARLCMELDMPNYQEKLYLLSSALLFHDSGERPQVIKNYLDRFANSSTYPLFRRERAKLQEDQYTGNVVQTWTRDRYRGFVSNLMEQMVLLYPFIFEAGLLSRSFPRPGMPHTYVDIRIEREMTEFGAERQAGYFGLIHLLIAAEGRAFRRLRDKSSFWRNVNLGIFETRIDDRAKYLRDLLMITEPDRCLAEILDQKLLEYEESHLPSGSPFVRELWRAAADLRSANPNLKYTARRRLLKKLAQGDYDHARTIVKKTMIATPSMFPAGLGKRLGFDPDEIFRKRQAGDQAVFNSWRQTRKDGPLNRLLLRMARRELGNAEGSIRVEFRPQADAQQPHTLIIYKGKELITPPHPQLITPKWLGKMIEEHSLLPVE